MTRMNEVVGICLHRALRSSVFCGGGRPWFADAAARCGDGVKAVLQQWASRPRGREQASEAVRSSASEGRMNNVCGRRVARDNAARRCRCFAPQNGLDESH